MAGTASHYIKKHSPKKLEKHPHCLKSNLVREKSGYKIIFTLYMYRYVFQKWNRGNISITTSSVLTVVHYFKMYINMG